MAFDADGTIPNRRATVVCFDRSANATYRAVVSLNDDRVQSFEHVPGVQANFTVDEFVECDQVLRSHPDVVAALAKRVSRFPRAWAIVTTGDGRTGAGWLEWNRNQS